MTSDVYDEISELFTEINFNENPSTIRSLGNTFMLQEAHSTNKYWNYECRINTNYALTSNGWKKESAPLDFIRNLEASEVIVPMLKFDVTNKDLAKLVACLAIDRNEVCYDADARYKYTPRLENIMHHILCMKNDNNHCDENGNCSCTESSKPMQIIHIGDELTKYMVDELGFHFIEGKDRICFGFGTKAQTFYTIKYKDYSGLACLNARQMVMGYY